MTKQEHINHWLTTSERDLEAANSLFLSAKYDWCLFIGHLCLEKVLKAHYIKANEENEPPKIHDLVRLAELARLNLDEEILIFFEKVNGFHIETRYPEYKQQFYKIATKTFTEENFTKIMDYYKWLVSLLK